MSPDPVSTVSTASDPITGKWIINSGDDFKIMVKGYSYAKVHHIIPKRLIKYMNKKGYNFHVDDVAGAVLSKEDHDLLEEGLKAVIPYSEKAIKGEPADLLADLAKFYANHDDPNVKKLANVVDGFRAKLNLLP